MFFFRRAKTCETCRGVTRVSIGMNLPRFKVEKKI